MNKSELEIKDLILGAFADESIEAINLNHQDCVIVRSQLIGLRDSDVKKLLPIVLIDLLETHTNNYANTEDSDAVIRLLTPVGLMLNEESDQEMGLTKAEEEYLAEGQAKLYSLFSSKQAAAIAAWLETAQDWLDLLFCRDQIKMAYGYWSKRAKS
jgi:hypothetical protein